jgi:hypothetical protein
VTPERDSHGIINAAVSRVYSETVTLVTLPSIYARGDQRGGMKREEKRYWEGRGLESRESRI